MKTKFFAIIIAAGLAYTTGVAQTPDTVSTVSQNPFPSSTELTIHNLTKDTVSFKIYNIHGQVVVDFFDSLVLSGTITETFIADSLPDGIYFARLTKNSENHSIKLLKYQGATNLTYTQNDKCTIQIYPNPTIDRLTISTDLKITELTIYDLNGRQLYQLNSGLQNNINMSNFDDGLYLLHLKTNGRTYIKRIMKK